MLAAIYSWWIKRGGRDFGPPTPGETFAGRLWRIFP